MGEVKPTAPPLPINNMPRRSKNNSPWGYCGRCGKKTHLDDMKWQGGVLKCDRRTCKDKMVLGQFEKDVEKELRTIPGSKEGQPHEILTEPSLKINLDEIVI